MTSELQSLLDGIATSMRRGDNFVSPLGRSRLATKGISVGDAWHTVKSGTPVATREIDRVKFYDNDRIIFIALSNDGIAILINGFLAGPKTQAEANFKES